MKSLKELYRIGPGPSSHTLGPMRACLKFKEAHQRRCLLSGRIVWLFGFDGERASQRPDHY